MISNDDKRLPRIGLKVLRVAGVIFSLVALALVSLVMIVTCSRRDFVRPDTSQWQTGDIFFSAGNSWRSLAVRWFGDESENEVTHTGFILMVDGQPMLVHMSTEKGVITMENVDDYARINDVNSITARRLNSPVDSTRLRSRLNYMLSTGKRFDNDFNLRDTSEYYCTEFVVRVLQKEGNNDFLPLMKKDYIYPVDLENSPYLHKL